MNANQTAAAESLPQPSRVVENVANDYIPNGAALIIDAHGAFYAITTAGDIEDGTYAYYRHATNEALRGAAAINRYATTYHLGDTCHGVAIERPGFLAILATVEDDPMNGWGYWTGDPDGEGPFSDTWADIPANWGDGSNPYAMGAAFARAFRAR